MQRRIVIVFHSGANSEMLELGRGECVYIPRTELWSCTKPTCLVNSLLCKGTLPPLSPI